MELDKIRELVELVEQSQIQELELSNRGETIRISKAGGVPVTGAFPAAMPAAAPKPKPLTRLEKLRLAAKKRQEARAAAQGGGGEE